MDLPDDTSGPVSGPFITLDTWVSEGRRQRAPRIVEVRAVFLPLAEDPNPRLFLQGLIDDEGLPMTWTLRTRSRINHAHRRLTITLDVLTEPLPTMRRVEPFVRSMSLLVLTDPRPGARYSELPYDVRIVDSHRRTLATLELVLRPRPMAVRAFPLVNVG
jgi:hypothetical protein